MDSILILMSTYNGEKYISEQLNSIINQKNVKIHLLIRDDGSTDSSPIILENFSQRFSNEIDIIRGKNIGCLKSFFELIISASKKYKGYDYYAFADQDDVWLPEKLFSATSSLNSIDNDLKLYYCKPQYVDQNLCYLKKKPIKALGTLAEAFILAPSLGCTMVFNEKLLQELSQACLNNICCLHDSLAYRLSLALGGTVVYDEKPHILYRQHSSNVVGGVQSTKNRWKRRIRWFIAGNKTKSTVARDILKYYKNKIPEKNKIILQLISSYADSIGNKTKILFSTDYKCNKISHNIMFKIGIIFNKI